MASSADGSKLLAAANGGRLYTASPFALTRTSTGVTGSLSGSEYHAVDLQCIGNNTFMVRSYAGYPAVQ